MRNYLLNRFLRYEKCRKMLRENGVQDDTRFFISEVAGLQFYDAHKSLLDGAHNHKVGDRVSLQRRASNEYDENAVEVWTANGRIMCGHLPRPYARRIAPLLDDLKSINALCFMPYDGDTYSMELLIWGDDVPSELDYETTQLRATNLEDYYTTDEQIRAAYRQRVKREGDDRAFKSSLHEVRSDRLYDAVSTLMPETLEIDLDLRSLEDLTRGDLVKRRKHKNRHFIWKDSVPDNMRTRGDWNQVGYRPRKDAKPYATVGFSACYWVVADLFHARDVVPIKRRKRSAPEKVLRRHVGYKIR